MSPAAAAVNDATDNLPVAARPITLPHPVIILGRDDKGKPHASFFPATDCHSAEQAAARMGMLALKADRDEVRACLPKLPKGKLFDSGKAFVPFVKQDLYREIVAHLPEDQRSMAEQVRTPPAEPPGVEGSAGDFTTLPEDWSTLKAGNLVLATEGGGEPWYEAIVVSVYSNESVRLRWRDYHDEPLFTRPVVELAMLHPARQVK